MRHVIILGGCLIGVVLAWWLIGSGEPALPVTFERSGVDGAVSADSHPEAAVPNEAEQEPQRVAVTAEHRCQLIIRTIDAEAGSAVTFVPCEWAPGDGNRTLDYRSAGRTDHAGQLALGEMSPGRYAVRAPGGDAVWVELLPGQPGTAVLALPTTARIRGRVVDRGGLELRDAEVWLSARQLDGGDVQVATSGAGGGFEFGVRGRDRLVWALVPDVGCSRPVPLNQPALESGEVVLVVEDPLARVVGRVNDAGGHAVAGARVAIGRHDHEHRRAIAMAPYEVQGRLLRRPVEAVTDSAGRFDIVFAPGAERTPVCVRKHGLAPWHETVALVVGATTRVDVELADAVTLRGVVRDREGAPAVGACIEVGGPSDAPPWMDARALSAADGSYAVVGIAAGDFRARVDDQRRGSARGGFSGHAGEQIEWNPVLDPGHVIRGRVVDANGAALAGWVVEVQSGPRRVGRRTTDSGGGFLVLHCKAEPHVVSVQQLGAWMPTEIAHAEGVMPDGDAVVIRVPADALACCFIAGEIRSASGDSLSGNVSITVVTDKYSQQLTMPLKPGPFSLGPLVAGRFDVTFTFPGHDRLAIEPFTLQRGDTYGLGVRTCRQNARLSVRVTAGGESVSGGTARLLDSAGEFVRAESLRNGVAEFEVPVGHYSLLVSVPQHPFARQHVDVLPGPATAANVELPAGIACRFVLDGGERSQSGTAELSWRSASIGSIGSEVIRVAAGEGGRLEFHRVLAPGRYSLSITTMQLAVTGMREEQGELELVVPVDSGGQTFVVQMAESARGQNGGSRR